MNIQLDSVDSSVLVLFRRKTPSALYRLKVGFISLAGTGLLAVVGCGSSTKPPETLSYSASTAVYVKGTAITPNTPTTSGGVPTSFAVMPSLPAGLTFNTSTGIISGTPTAISPQATYTVTASNSGGNTNASLNVTVNDQAPTDLSYSSNPAIYLRGMSITPNTPTTSGGMPTSYMISPTLPPGLIMNSSTGVITGTPSVFSASTTYAVTAENVTGSTSTNLNITVNDSHVFVPTGNMDVGRVGSSATLLNDGMVLMAGGSGFASAILYSPVTGSFTPTGSMSVIRNNPTGTLLNDGTVLIAGGNNSATLSNTELYRTSSGIFTATGSMNTGRYFPTAALLDNGMVLVVGGVGGAPGLTYLTSAELYDPSTGTFTSTGSTNAPRYLNTSTLLKDGTVLIVGGAVYNTGTALASAEIYNPTTGIFTATGSMSTGRFWHTATLLPNGEVLITGGHNGSTSLASAELYNPSTGTFTLTGSMSTPRNFQTATLLKDGTVLIAGGFNSISRTVLASAELYNVSTRTFMATGSLGTARNEPTATLLQNGIVLIAGGADVNGNSIASAELYLP